MAALKVAMFVIVALRRSVTFITSCIPAPVGLEALKGAEAPMLQATAMTFALRCTTMRVPVIPKDGETLSSPRSA